MTVLIVYSSQMGTTQMLADVVKNEIAKKHTAETQHASSTSVDQIKAAEAVVFAIPTYDEGEIEGMARPLIEELAELEGVNMPFGIVAPGDTAYEYFAGAGEKIKEAAEKAGMKEVCPMLKIDNYMMNIQTANSEIEQWAQDFATQLEG